MKSTELYEKLNTLPEHLQKEVEDFVDFLKSKNDQKISHPQERKAGLAKGLIHMKEDFNEPLEDFKEYM